jgi:hypothetical protein
MRISGCDSSCPIELVFSKKDLLAIRALGDHEFLLDPLDPIFYIHGVFGLREGGGASSQELHQMGLVWWWRWGYLLLVGLHAVEGPTVNTALIPLVIPRSEKEGMKPPYVCPGCSNHTYSNNMITRFHVQ